MNSLSPIIDTLRHVWPRVPRPQVDDDALLAKIGEAAAPLARCTDNALAGKTAELRRAVEGGRPPTAEELLVPAFALVVEAARRTLGINLYQVQLLGGLALARGTIAEMQTGEGKTFVAMLPAFLHALAGKGVHVMTVNQYLAERDYELLAPVYRLLGMTVGLGQPETEPSAKRKAYECDITYGPGYEFGFDYLRDQVLLLSQRKPKLGETYRGHLRGQQWKQPVLSQRGHAVAIIDEADSVMLDEATTPLILAAGGSEPAANSDAYRAATDVADQLSEGEHFTTDDQTGSVRLTRQGRERVTADLPRIAHKRLDRPWAVYVEQAVRAKKQFHRDVHYIVRDDEILLVDQNTGRIFTDRSWRGGLQQAVQAKEGVTIRSETESIARITRQRYFRLYGHLCGMSGTAQGGQRELRDVYRLGVVVIPPHRPCLRKTLPTRCFIDLPSKEEAIVAEIVRIHATQQPILVGTAAIERSEALAQRLDHCNVSYQLLNGKQDAEEAAIVAGAGGRGVITIATNMAGRGTDIKLPPGVAELGGLHVIATEPQESTRVDRQLVGRAARQGDPGSCQLFASAEDLLFTRYDPMLVRRMKQMADASGEIRADLSQDIANVQRRVERHHAKLRRQIFDHDDWLETVLGKLNASK